MGADVSDGKYQDEIDIRELIRDLWLGRRVIIAFTVAFASVSIVVALSIPNQYRATAVLAPAQSEGGGLSSALGQLSGLASLAGVSIGSGQSSESEIAQEVMRSWSFVDNFISENNLSVAVFATEGWNKKSGELLIDEDKYDQASNTWLLDDEDSDELRPPTSWELFEQFQDMLTISADSKTGLTTISIDFYAPDIAKHWVDLYIESINAHMQARQVSKVTRNISYLEDQISRTSITEMKEVFYTIIEEQTKNKMVAEASPDYAFVTVSPSMVPEEKFKPQRALICALMTVFGGALGIIVVLVKRP